MILLNAKAMQGEWGNILASYHFPLIPLSNTSYFELKTFVKKKGNIIVNILKNKLGNIPRMTIRNISRRKFRNILSGYRASWEKPR